ncbi:tetraacyldisaccharide 4'-kinase [Alteromonas halophila]|uniref:Tetraacyldisaccharide 4'-kinase n=1 Tax=Alteromonas halophila TaxID=516698 RepID=A0A918JMS2_9ALTE|nr:tetraacyldisaccharide 4'-kinase [Alteromonas halophila]GGW87852.1 tetraacyldisaccharide 4'-kinase [Alteromonas halophila]
MASLSQRWYQGHPLLWLLWPLSMLFALLSAARRLAYRLNIIPVTSVTADVIVVGNISVGGNGKTPLVIALASHFREKGRRVGILSRGYGGNNSTFPRQVLPGDDARDVGDEPLLMATRTGVPVVIDPKRARGARFLVDSLQCDIIICDDGLQHYALARDAEVVVMDERRWGSGHLLPMGPLREGRWRLNKVDAVVHNTARDEGPYLPQITSMQVSMHLEAGRAINVKYPQQTAPVSELHSEPVTALAGIGNPDRFFRQLETMGLAADEQIRFNDHHVFSREDIPQGRVIMTEKDAVKVTALAHDDCWFLPVTAALPTDFYTHIASVLENASHKGR